MTDALDAFHADDLERGIASVDELLHVLGLSREVIDFDKISYDTGLTVERVRGLLAGEEAGPEDLSQTFQRRLVFLRETRRKPNGKKYTLDEIGQGAGISKGQVGFLLNGQRMPGLAGVSKLERFFAVQPGFFTATDRQALRRALQPIHEQLTHLALLKGQGITRLAMRSGASGEDSKLDRELRAALTVALAEPEGDREDPELRELTEEIRALPTKSRRRIFPVLRGLLGLARPEEEKPARPSAAEV
ncbi:helix-turn-helix domain-containing protein [Streptomyces triculaminicus]|uniref:helix-turn-helix domain-containing protein n=1 Tax=Streptomyces triculaminicus TaxID=2816232 RepID=UPI0037B92251